MELTVLGVEESNEISVCCGVGEPGAVVKPISNSPAAGVAAIQCATRKMVKHVLLIAETASSA
jgi:hypothetical protein